MDHWPAAVGELRKVNVFFTSVQPGVALIWTLQTTHDPVVDAESVLSMTRDEAEACIKVLLERMHHPRTFMESIAFKDPFASSKSRLRSL